MADKLPSSRRKPGILVRIQDLLPPYPKRPLTIDGIKTYITGLLEFFPKFARNQDDLNRYVWMMEGSLPGKHGRTHLGGDDNIVSSQMPSPVTLDAVGSPGTPQLGVAAIDHIHPSEFDFPANPVPQDGVQGNPNPPFSTLEQQTDWLNSVAVGSYALNIFKAGIR